MALKGEVLDALLAAGATAEMIVAAVKADAADDERKLLRKREIDAARQRRHRGSRNVTRTRRDPPIEDHTPPVSSIDETKPSAKSKQTPPAKPDGVREPTWRDFQSHRRAKKAPITETALAAIEREATSIGWTMEAALTEIVARDWRGFKAEWIDRPQANGRSPPANDGGGSLVDRILARQASP